MITVTTSQAQSQFAEWIECSQSEPVGLTRQGQVVAYLSKFER